MHHPRAQTLGTTPIKCGGDEMGSRDINQRLKVDGHDDAIIGTGNSFGRTSVLIYDSEKIINKLMKRDKMTHEEAEEFFEFNIIGGWLGDQTPMFLTRIEE